MIWDRGRREFVAHATREPRNYRRIEDAVLVGRAAKIYEFRKQMGWSRLKLATKMGTTMSSVIRWEFGIHQPNGMAWKSFQRVRDTVRRRVIRQGRDLDGGPVMDDDNL